MTALLVLVAVLGWLGGLSAVHAQQPPAHAFAGEAFIDSSPAPDGTTITAWINGRPVAKTPLKNGKYTLVVEQPQGQSYAGQTVTFRVGKVQTGERRKWKQSGSTLVNLNAYVRGGASGSQDRLPGRFIRECVLNALGRLPSSKKDMTAQELRKALELCPALNGRLGALERSSQSLRDQQPRVRGEGNRPTEQRRLETRRISQEREIQVEQQRLDAERTRRDQERIQREQTLQQQQDRLDRDRLKSERERQLEQSRLDAERLKQDQDRIKAEKEFQLEQQLLDQRRAREEQQHQEELEKARFESERARISRERALEEERARLDQERLQREQDRRQGQSTAGQPLVNHDPNQPPGDSPVKSGPSRGFFTNTQVGGLGAVNQLADPTMLAVLGILITMGAALMQMVKGS